MQISYHIGYTMAQQISSTLDEYQIHLKFQIYRWWLFKTFFSTENMKSFPNLSKTQNSMLEGYANFIYAKGVSENVYLPKFVFIAKFNIMFYNDM